MLASGEPALFEGVVLCECFRLVADAGGLSMVYGFAKQSEGHITTFSEVGDGTTVKLYMPRSEESFVQKGAKDDTQEFSRGSARILVV